MSAPPAPGRRELAYAVLLCLAGAGLALFAAGRTWSLQVTERPGGLPDLRAARTGAAIVGWLPPLAVVGLAGAGALLATRGTARRVVGGVLLLAGTGVVVGAGVGLLGVDRGAAGAAAAGWPLLCLAGGLLAAAGGGWALARGPAWPAMGSRYERAARDPARDAGRVEPDGPVDTRDTWDALDRGEDPTDT